MQNTNEKNNVQLKKSPVAILAGVWTGLSLLYFIFTLFMTYRNYHMLPSMTAIMFLLGEILLVIAMFGKMVFPLGGLGFCLMFVSLLFGNGSLASVLSGIEYLLFAAFFFLLFFWKEGEQKEKIRKLWFIPSAIALVLELVNIISTFVKENLLMDYLTSILGMLIFLGSFVGIIPFFLWMNAAAYPYGRTEVAKKTDGSIVVPPAAETGYRNLTNHILLLFFTVGIYPLIWIYKTTELLNKEESFKERIPTIQVVLCMFVPFYIVFWNYRSAQVIDKMAEEKGIDSKLAVPCLILSIFVGCVPPILLQNKLNELAISQNGNRK